MKALNLETAPPPPPAPVHRPLSHNLSQDPRPTWEGSTLSKATARPDFLDATKPRLDPPDAHALYQLCDTYVNRLEPRVLQWLKLKETLIEQTMTSIQAQHTEQAKQMDEAIKKSQQCNFWGILKDIGSMVNASMGLYFGSRAFFSANPIAGGALIASGLLTVANLAFHHGEIWNWIAEQMAKDDPELKEKIAAYIPIACGLAATSLSFTGVWGTWAYAQHTGLEIARSILKSTVDITDNLINYKSGMANADRQFHLAQVNALKTKIDLGRLNLTQIISDAEAFHNKQTEMHATLGQVVKHHNQQMHRIQQPV